MEQKWQNSRTSDGGTVEQLMVEQWNSGTVEQWNRDGGTVEQKCLNSGPFDGGTVEQSWRNGGKPNPETVEHVMVQ